MKIYSIIFTSLFILTEIHCWYDNYKEFLPCTEYCTNSEEKSCGYCQHINDDSCLTKPEVTWGPQTECIYDGKLCPPCYIDKFSPKVGAQIEKIIENKNLNEFIRQFKLTVDSGFNVIHIGKQTSDRVCNAAGHWSQLSNETQIDLLYYAHNRSVMVLNLFDGNDGAFMAENSTDFCGKLANSTFDKKLDGIDFYLNSDDEKLSEWIINCTMATRSTLGSSKIVSFSSNVKYFCDITNIYNVVTRIYKTVNDAVGDFIDFFTIHYTDTGGMFNTYDSIFIASPEFSIGDNFYSKCSLKEVLQKMNSQYQNVLILKPANTNVFPDDYVSPENLSSWYSKFEADENYGSGVIIGNFKITDNNWSDTVVAAVIN